MDPGFGPDEWLGVLVVRFDEGIDNKGFSGMQRWVGLGIIADNLINIGRAIERRADP